MHAVIMCEFGTAAVLRPGEFPDPAARPGWVTVALRAAALNWHDVLVRQGRYQSPLPHVPGADGAGTDVETGGGGLVVASLWRGPRCRWCVSRSTGRCSPGHGLHRASHYWS